MLSPGMPGKKATLLRTSSGTFAKTEPVYSQTAETIAAPPLPSLEPSETEAAHEGETVVMPADLLFDALTERDLEATQTSPALAATELEPFRPPFKTPVMLPQLFTPPPPPAPAPTAVIAAPARTDAQAWWMAGAVALGLAVVALGVAIVTVLVAR